VARVDAVETARRFGLDGRARLSDGPVARGRQGVVWRLETPDGRWAVKVPFDPTDEQDARASTAFQEAAWAAGVPTPRVQRTTDGDVFASVEGVQIRLYEWVDLLGPDPLLDPALLGSVVAAMHQVPAPEGGTPDAWHSAPVGAARWDGLVVRLHDAGAPFAGRLADLRGELVALESWLEPPSEVRTCHCDLWADNVLPTAGGGLCVIDWENSGPADPSQELACVLFEFARTEAGRARALMAAYRDAGGPASVDRRGHFTMLIAQLGHITELAARDWLEPNPRSPDRADSVAWISEVFDEPHTRAVLDELLAVVSRP
jgi:aminoglycoside phosphotransferase (APT) family kinase protein